jgi:hypothetical protein
MKALDSAIINNYHNWINNAPRQYIEDDFFHSRVPVAVTSRFGQNQQLAKTEDELDEERLNWTRDRDYSRIRYVTLALATHLRVRRASQWRAVLSEDIIQTHPEGVYSSIDRDDREMISWEEFDEMDVLDDAQREIPIYSETGFRIPRRIPRFDRRTTPHGILMDTRVVKDLFEAPFELQGHQNELVDVFTYPQAGLKIAGHFQANGLMKNFLPFLKEVNEDLTSISMEDDDELDHTPERQIRTVVGGLACQGYNAVMHSTRGDSAQHHDAQLGMITGALAGSWAKGEVNKRRAGQLRERCSRQLPHASFTEKIQNTNILRDFRLENVYYIDVEAMCSDSQDGQYVLSHSFF